MGKHRKLYDSLLKNGELLELFPDFTGDWEEDKKAFIAEQEEVDALIKELDTDIDLDDEY